MSGPSRGARWISSQNLRPSHRPAVAVATSPTGLVTAFQRKGQLAVRLLPHECPEILEKL